MKIVDSFKFLVNFLRLTLIAAAVLAIIYGSWFNLLIIVITLVFTFLPHLVEKRYKIIFLWTLNLLLFSLFMPAYFWERFVIFMDVFGGGMSFYILFRPLLFVCLVLLLFFFYLKQKKLRLVRCGLPFFLFVFQ